MHCDLSRTLRHTAVPIAVGALALAAFAAPGSASASTSTHPAVPLFGGPQGASIAPHGAVAGNLLSTVAISSKDVWAFGYSQQDDGTFPALAQHYNGHKWTTVTMPSPAGSLATYPFTATAFSSDDVWAVGHSENANGNWSTLTEHWDGSSWSIVASPNQTGADDSYLYAISGSSPNDVWAVGTGLNEAGEGVNKTFAIHWDGTQWAEVPTPAPSATLSELNGVVALSSDNVWAAGAYQANGAIPSLLEHWNGSKWKTVKSPNEAGAELTQLGPLVASAPDDIWSIGYEADSSGALLPLAAHYNGRHWSLRLMENPSDSLGVILLGGSGSGPDDVWGSGIYINSSGEGLPLIEHYNGKKWKISKAPQPPGGSNSQLTGLSSPSATDAWAVGQTQVNGVGTTLLEHYNGKRWSAKQGK